MLLNHTNSKILSVIAPSSPVTDEEIDKARDYFKSLGFHVKTPNFLNKTHVKYWHNDSLRFDSLKESLYDPEVSIIVALRGGYGLTRLMPQLLTLKKPFQKKIFLGFSDGTALHIFLNQFWDWPSIHGPNAIQLSHNLVSLESITSTIDLLTQGISKYTSPSIIPLNNKAKELPNLTGKLIGGNLCILTTSLGTSWQTHSHDKILLFEDCNEKGYQIDRMLNHLIQSNFFVNAKAVLLGDFTEGKEDDGTSTVEKALEGFIETIDIPIFRITNCGHSKNNFPILLNIDLKFPINHN